MTGKKFIMLAILLAGLLTLSAVSAAENITSEGTDEIASIENQEILKENNDGTFTDLANEIANATEELTLNRNYIYSDRDAGGWITIDKSITINGNGHTIDGNNEIGVGFTISGADVILNNINFIKSSTLWHGENGKMTNCNFINCSSSNYGGAIHWTGNDGDLTDCNFINCSSSNYGGAIHWTGAKGTIKNNTFINATAQYGGAIYGKSPNSLITDNTIINTTDDNAHNAICWESDYSTLSNNKIINCNLNLYYGYAIYYWGSNGIITNNTIINTTSAIYYAYGSNGIITNHTFINTTRTAIKYDGSNGIVANCTFINTSSDIPSYFNSGSAIYWTGTNGTVTNCNFTNSTAKGYGGAVYWNGDGGSITYCSFINSTADLGGAVYWDAANGKIANCNFTNSTARYSGSEFRIIRNIGGAIYWNSENGTVINSKFSNSTGWHGSGICWNGENGAVKNCIFINTIGLLAGQPYNEGGGAIRWTGENGEISNNVFINSNTIITGSAIYCEGKNTEIMNNIFINSSTTGYYEGAVYCKADYVTLSNCTFINSSSWKGGAIYLEGICCGISDCTFINSTATLNGGAIFLNTTDSIITKCTFINSSKGDGGAIICTGKNTEIANCIFMNSTGYCGGAINWKSEDGKIENCTFINSTSTWEGGAIFRGEQYGAVNGIITGCTFINSTAALDGGSIFWLSKRNGKITDCNFTNSTAKEHGGAIYTSSAGKVKVLNCNYVNSYSEYEEAPYYFGWNGKVETKISYSFADAADNNGKILVATLKDTNENPIKDAKLTFVVWKGTDPGVDKVPGSTKTLTTNSKGQASYPTDGISLNGCIVTITFAGDDIYSATCKEADPKFKKTDTTLFARYDATGKKLVAVLKDVNGRYIKGAKIGFVMPDGVKYAVTYISGEAEYSVNHLAEGSYSVQAAFLGNDYYNPSNKVTVKFTVSKTATQLTAKYDAGSKNIIATVKDANGNPVSGLKVGFAINGVKYVITDANGQAKYSTEGLADNTYKATIQAYGNNIYANSNKQTITFTVGDKEQSKIFLRNALYFVLQTKYVTVTLGDSNNNPLAGKTIHITLNEYGLKYTGITNENGEASIKVGVGFGVHSATVSFDGDENYTASEKTGSIRVIKETPSVMVRGADTQFKASDNPKIVKVYLKDRYNKPLPVGSKIFIKINGQTFSATTDSEGIAHVEIKLNRQGTFTAQAIYAGNSAYNAVTKDIKIYVK